MKKAFAFLNRVKVLIGGVVALAIGLYDVITAGGIDLGGILKPILGASYDVGRLLSIVSLVVVVLRFAMQSGLFKSDNLNGLDAPEEK